MILKRILPVIAAIAVLCCMMIVPASAAFWDDEEMGYIRLYTYCDLSLDINTGAGNLFLESPSVITNERQSWVSSVSGVENGSAEFTLYTAQDFPDHSLGSDEYAIKIETSTEFYYVDFYFSDFVLPYDPELLSKFFRFYCDGQDAYTVSFNFAYADNGVPNAYSFADSVDVSGDTTATIFSEAALNALAGEGIPQGSFVYFYNVRLSAEFEGSDTVLYSQVYTDTSSEIPHFNDFLYFNDLDFGGDEVVIGGSGILQGFSDFLTSGVSSFLATPLFGDFSLGEILAGVVSVLLALVIIKMFAH